MTIVSDSRSSQEGGQAESAATVMRRDQVFHSALPFSSCEERTSADHHYPVPARLQGSAAASFAIPSLFSHSSTERAACRSPRVVQTPRIRTDAYSLQQNKQQEQRMREDMLRPPQPFVFDALVQQSFIPSREEQEESQHHNPCFLPHRRSLVHLEPQQSQRQQTASIHQLAVSAPSASVHQRRSSTAAQSFRQPQVQPVEQDRQLVRPEQKQPDRRTVESAGSATDQSTIEACPVKAEHVLRLSPSVRFPPYSSAVNSGVPWQHQEGNCSQVVTGGRRSCTAVTELATTRSPRSNIPCNLVVPRVMFFHHSPPKETSDKSFSSPAAASVPGAALPVPVTGSEVSVVAALRQSAQVAAAPGVQIPDGVGLRTTAVETAADDGCFQRPTLTPSPVSGCVASSPRGLVSPCAGNRLGTLPASSYAAHFNARMPAFVPLQPDAASGESTFSPLFPSSIAAARAREASATAADGRGLECVGGRLQQRPVASVFSTCGNPTAVPPRVTVVASRWRSAADPPAVICSSRSPAVPAGTTDSVAAREPCPLRGRAAAVVSPLQPATNGWIEPAAAGDRKGLRRGTLRLPAGITASAADGGGFASTGSAERGDQRIAPCKGRVPEDELVYFPVESTIGSPWGAATSLEFDFRSHCFKEAPAATSVGKSRSADHSAGGADDSSAELDGLGAWRISEAGPASWHCPPAAASAGTVESATRHSGALVDRNHWTGCGNTPVKVRGSPELSAVVGARRSGFAAGVALPCGASSAGGVAGAEASACAPAKNSDAKGERNRESVRRFGKGSDRGGSISSSGTTGTIRSESCTSKASGVSYVPSVLLAREGKRTSTAEKKTDAVCLKTNYVYFSGAECAAPRARDAVASASVDDATHAAISTPLESSEFCEETHNDTDVESLPPSTSSKDLFLGLDSAVTAVAAAGAAAECGHATVTAQHAYDAQMVPVTAKKSCGLTAAVTAMRNDAPLQPKSSNIERGLENVSRVSSTVSEGGVWPFTRIVATRGNSGKTIINGGIKEKIVSLTPSIEVHSKDIGVFSGGSARFAGTPAASNCSVVSSALGAATGPRAASSGPFVAAAASAAAPPGSRAPEKPAIVSFGEVSPPSQAAGVALLASTRAPAEAAAAAAAIDSFPALTALTQCLSRSITGRSAEPQSLTGVDVSSRSAAIACIDSADVKPTATLQASNGILTRGPTPEEVTACSDEVAEELRGEATAETSLERAGRVWSPEAEEALKTLIELEEEKMYFAVTVGGDDLSAASSQEESTTVSGSPAISFLGAKAATAAASSYGREATISRGTVDNHRFLTLDRINPAAEFGAAADTAENAVCHESFCASSSSFTAAQSCAAIVCGLSAVPAMITDSVTSTTAAGGLSSPSGAVLATTADETPTPVSPQSARLRGSFTDAVPSLAISAARNAPFTLFRMAAVRTAAPSSCLTHLTGRTAVPAHAFPAAGATARAPQFPADKRPRQQEPQKDFSHRHAAASVEGAEDLRLGTDVLASLKNFWKEKRFDPFLRSPRNITPMASSGPGRGAVAERVSGPASAPAVLSSLPSFPACSGAPGGAPAAQTFPSKTNPTAACLSTSVALRCPTVTAGSSVCSSFSPFSTCGAMANSCVSPPGESRSGFALSDFPSSCDAARASCGDSVSQADCAVGIGSPHAAATSDGAAKGREIATGAIACDASSVKPLSGAANAEFAFYTSAGLAAKSVAAGSSDAAEGPGGTLEAGNLPRDLTAGGHERWRLAAAAALAPGIPRGVAPSSSRVVMLSPPSTSPASSLLLKAVSFQRRSASSPTSPVSHPVSDPELGEDAFLPLLQQQLLPQQQLRHQQAIIDQQQLPPHRLHVQQQRLRPAWQLQPRSARDAASPVLSSQDAYSSGASAVDSRDPLAVLIVAETAVVATAPGGAASCSKDLQTESRLATCSPLHGSTRSSRCGCPTAGSSNTENDLTTNTSTAGYGESFASHNHCGNMNETNHSSIDFVPVGVDSATVTGKTDCRFRRSTPRSISAENTRSCSGLGTSSDEIIYARCVNGVSENNTRSSSCGSPRNSSCNRGTHSGDRNNTQKANGKAATGFGVRRLHAHEVKRNEFLAGAAAETGLSTNESFASVTVDNASLFPATAGLDSCTFAPSSSGYLQNKSSDAAALPGTMLAADTANILAFAAVAQAREPAADVATLEKGDVLAAVAAASAASVIECKAPHRLTHRFDQRVGHDPVAAAASSDVCSRCADAALSIEDTAAGSDFSTEDRAAESPTATADANVAGLASRLADTAAATISDEMETEAAANRTVSEGATSRPAVLAEMSTAILDDEMRLPAAATAAPSSQRPTEGITAKRQAGVPSGSKGIISGDTPPASWPAKPPVELEDRKSEQTLRARAVPEVSDQSASIPVDIIIPPEAAVAPSREQRHARATSREGAFVEPDKVRIRSSDVGLRCSESSSTPSSTRSRCCSPLRAPAPLDCGARANIKDGEATAIVVIGCRVNSGATLAADAATLAPAQLTSGRTSSFGSSEDVIDAEEESIASPLANVLVKFAPKDTIVVAALPGSRSENEECCPPSSVYSKKSSRESQRGRPAVAVCLNNASETGIGAVVSFSAALPAADSDIDSEEENVCQTHFAPGWQQAMLSQVAAASSFFTSAPVPADTCATPLSAQAAAAASETPATLDSGAAVAVVLGAAVPVGEKMSPVASYAGLPALGPSAPVVGDAAGDGEAAAGQADNATVCGAAVHTLSCGSGESVSRVAGGDNYVGVGAASDAADESPTEEPLPAGRNSGQAARAAPITGLSTAAGAPQDTAGGSEPAACTVETLSGLNTKAEERKRQEEIEQEEVEEQKREEAEAFGEVGLEHRAMAEPSCAATQHAHGASQQRARRGQARAEHIDTEKQDRESIQHQNRLQVELEQRIHDKTEEQREIDGATGGGAQEKEEIILHAPDQRERPGAVTRGASQQEFTGEEPVRLREQPSSAGSLGMQQHQSDEVAQQRQQSVGTTGGEKIEAGRSRRAAEHLPGGTATAAAGDADEKAMKVAHEVSFQNPPDELTVRLCPQTAEQVAAADGGTAKTSDEQRLGVAVETGGLNGDVYIHQKGQQGQQRPREQVGTTPFQDTHSGTIRDLKPSNCVVVLPDPAGGLAATLGEGAADTQRNDRTQGSAEAAAVPATVVEPLDNARACPAANDTEESGYPLRALAPAAAPREVADSHRAALQGTAVLAEGGGGSPTAEGAPDGAGVSAAAETCALPGTAGAPEDQACGGIFVDEPACTISQRITVAERERTQDVGTEEAPQEGAYTETKMLNDNTRGDTESVTRCRAGAQADGVTRVMTQGDSRQEYLAIYERASNQVWYNGNVFNSVQMWVRWLEARETHAFLMQRAEGDEIASLSSSSSSFSSLSGGDDSDSDSYSDSGSDGDSGSDSDSDSEGDATELLQSPIEHRLRALPIGAPVTPPQRRELRTAGTVNLAVAADGACHITSRGATQQQQRQGVRQSQHRSSTPSTGFLPDGIPNQHTPCTLSISTRVWFAGTKEKERCYADEDGRKRM